jgi:acyl carrier protein
MSTQREITEYIVAQYLPGTPPEELPASYDLLDTGVIDSLSLIQLIGWISERYGIPVEQIDLAPDDFRSVAAIDAFVSRHSSTRNSQVSAAAVAAEKE